MLYIGKIVSTHGIKGELRILSDFQYKDKVFRVGNNLVINKSKSFVLPAATVTVLLLGSDKLILNVISASPVVSFILTSIAYV